MAVPLPDYFYRFRGDNPKYLEVELDNLFNDNSAFISPLMSQNDIFEGRPRIFSAKDWEIHQFRDSLKKKVGNDAVPSGNTAQQVLQGRIIDRKARRTVLKDIWSPSKLREIRSDSLEAILSSYSIACFNAAKPKQVMWAHYANNHKGICLKFKIKPGFENVLKSKDFFKIGYFEERPSLTEIDILKFQANSNLQSPFDQSLDPKEYVDKFLLTKSTEWEYENEWRWIDSGKAEGGRYIDITPLKLNKIICGARSTQTTQEICVAAANSQVPVHLCTPSTKDYSFNYQALN